MTSTSGPGFSLMMENIGLGMMTETPCVVVNVQRGGPSTGLPTLVGQADVMQARWGSHGDYGCIALAPSSPQECFEFTIEAFNLSEIYRQPVFVLADELVGHMSERVVIPKAEAIKVIERRKPGVNPKDYLPFDLQNDGMPTPMAIAGAGYHVHVTGLTHDERGYPVINDTVQERSVRRIVDKIRNNADKIIKYDAVYLDDAEVVVVAYGCTSRVARQAVQNLRDKGLKAGMVRLITLWPFPSEVIRRLSKRVKAFVVPEINYGQIVYEVDRTSKGAAEVVLMALMGGSIHTPEEIESVMTEFF
jgi:2-oxoglutarate/2-oxoacid ferredoxin oxidoreductase subunit alpha